MKRHYLYPIIIIAAILLGSFQTSHAAIENPHKLSVIEKWFDFQQLNHLIKSEYGPKEFKEEYLNMDIDRLAELYWNKMRHTKTNGEFYSLIVKFVAEFEDGHFNATIPTTLAAFAGFVVNRVNGQAVIEGVNRKILPEEIFPFKRGDRLISIDGRLTTELISNFQKYVQTGNRKSAKNEATQMLTIRSGKILPVPTGTATFRLESRETGQQTSVELEWILLGKPFDEHTLASSDAMALLLANSSLPVPYSPKPLSVTGFNPDDMSTFQHSEDLYAGLDYYYQCDPGTRIEIPADATILIEEPFISYYYPTPKGNVGYLRIPHYAPDIAADEWFANYEWALTQLERETVGLIIDQDHNCGGSVNLLEEIVALFMNRPFTPLEFQIRASKNHLLDWMGDLKSFEHPHFLQYDAISEVVGAIESAFDSGSYLTQKITLRGTQQIKPRNVYSKPVLILIDEQAGSGGDAFPAMMQGQGRATLMGSTTGGLGGYVDHKEPLFYSQIKLRLTMSMFFRPDGTPIENHGAVPDIPYTITLDDFTGGFLGYQKAYTKELLRLVK